MKAWAICDTDGLRYEPIPLISHIYSTKETAVQARNYGAFDTEFYPIFEVEIIVKKGGDE